MVGISFLKYLLTGKGPSSVLALCGVFLMAATRSCPCGLGIQMGVDIALERHHSLSVKLKDRMVNFPVRRGHNHVQDRHMSLIKKNGLWRMDS